MVTGARTMPRERNQKDQNCGDDKGFIQNLHSTMTRCRFDVSAKTAERSPNPSNRCTPSMPSSSFSPPKSLCFSMLTCQRPGCQPHRNTLQCAHLPENKRVGGNAIEFGFLLFLNRFPEGSYSLRPCNVDRENTTGVIANNPAL